MRQEGRMELAQERCFGLVLEIQGWQQEDLPLRGNPNGENGHEYCWVD